MKRNFGRSKAAAGGRAASLATLKRRSVKKKGAVDWDNVARSQTGTGSPGPSVSDNPRAVDDDLDADSLAGGHEDLLAMMAGGAASSGPASPATAGLQEDFEKGLEEEEWYGVGDDENEASARLLRLAKDGTIGTFVVHPAKGGGLSQYGLTVKGADGGLSNHLIRVSKVGGTQHWRLADDSEPFGAYPTVGKLVAALVDSGSDYFGVRLMYSPRSRAESAASFISREPGEVVQNPLFVRDTIAEDAAVEVDGADNGVAPHSAAIEQALAEAAAAERAHSAQLQQAEAQFDNLYGRLPFDESKVSADRPSAAAKTLQHEIASLKASIESQKSELLRMKAKRMKADETYLMLQDHLRLLVVDLEETEKEFDDRREKALKLESQDKATERKISEKQLMLETVTQQIGTSGATLHKQKLNLMRIHGDAKAQLTALNHDKMVVQRLHRERADLERRDRMKTDEGRQIEQELEKVKKQLKSEEEKLRKLSSRKDVSAKVLHETAQRITELEEEAAAATVDLATRQREVRELKNAEEALSSKLKNRSHLGTAANPSLDFLVSTPFDADLDRELGLAADANEPYEYDLSGYGAGGVYEEPVAVKPKTNDTIAALERSVRESRDATAEAYDFILGSGPAPPAGTVSRGWSSPAVPPGTVAGLELYPHVEGDDLGRLAGPIVNEALKRQRLESIEAYEQLYG